MDIKNFVKNTIAPPEESLRNVWIINKLINIPKGKSIIDVGAGQMPYRQYSKHLKYMSQDFGKYTGEGVKKGLQTGKFDSSRVDLVSDITSIPIKDKTFDYVLCAEVFEHLPDPLSALAEINRINKKRGRLLLTAPWASLTHFYPYFYYSGFSENFYKSNLPRFGYKIDEIYIYGNYFSWLSLEFIRLPLIVFNYNPFFFLLLIPFIIVAMPWYIFIRICDRLFPKSKDILAWGICIHATKLKDINIINTKRSIK